MLRFAVLITLVASIICGCGKAEVKVTEDQEKAFRNPPKEMPAEAAAGMKEAMQKAGGQQQSK